jgi:hypothetical protein
VEGTKAMMKTMAAVAVPLLLGCASISRGLIRVTDEAAVGDSTYVYGYAIVGRESHFQIVFENVASKERKMYSKNWAANEVYKEHIFAFLLPHGSWRIAEITTGGPYREYTYGPKKVIEIKDGFGNFIGKIDVQVFPISERPFADVQMIRDKRETDLLMQGRYPGFNAGKTTSVEYR